jgi:glycosyltransferase involved in cell wall biosynthesis
MQPPVSLQPRKDSLADAPSLSIVVIGRNEGERLARCLESVGALRGFAEVQVIYVDSASTDGSPETAARYGAQVVVVRPSRPTAAVGRNAGWRLASADFVLFLDGDTVLHPDFPQVAYDVMVADPHISTVWGHRREIHPEESIYNRVLDLDWIYAPGIVEACGGDVLMRTSALREVNGYDDHLIAGEEPELCRRLRARGYSIMHIDHPMTLHDLQITRWRQYWTRARRSGYAYAEVSDRFRHSNDPLWAADSRRSFTRAFVWIGTVAVALFTCLWFGALPLLFWVATFLGSSLRSAWKARWKDSNPMTLFLYGIHSQIQHLPICVGQLQFLRDKKAQRRRGLVEYK